MLTDEKKLRREVTKEIRQDIDTYGDERRTLIEEAKGASIAKQVIDEPVTVIVSEKGFLRSRQGHGFDARAMNFKLGDKYRCSMECRSVDNLYILSNTGRIYSIPVSSLPSARGEGTHVSAFVQFQDGDVPFDYICGARIPYCCSLLTRPWASSARCLIWRSVREAANPSLSWTAPNRFRFRSQHR